MNKLKRILTGIAVMTFMLSSVSCFQPKPITQNEEIHKEDTLKDTNQSAVIEKLTETSYKAVKLDADLPLTDITNIQNVGNTGKYLFSGVIGSGADWEWGTLLVESDLSAYKEFDNGINKTANIEFNENYVAANNGTIYAILTVTDYGDYELPDFNDPNFDYESFDYEEMAEAAVNTYKILTFDESGKVIAENEIEDFEESVNARADDMFGISECFALGDDKICISVIMSDETVFVTVDGEGNISEPIDFHTNEYLNYYGTDRDNNFVFMVNENGNSELRTLNADTMEISPDKITFEDNLYFNNIIKGSGDYRVYLSSQTSLYGLKDDGSLVELINWVDSDISANSLNSIVPVNDGDFFITEYSKGDGNAAIYRLTKRDAAEIENVKIINMAVEYSGGEIADKVKDFNMENSDYRITLTDYSEYFEYDDDSGKALNTPVDQLKRDIAAGKTYDIICLSGYSDIFSNLTKKGALVDLYTYLDKDSEYSREDFVPSLLSACEIDGQLSTLSPSFYISTFACKTKYYGKADWNLDEFIETCHNLPEGMKPFTGGNTKSDIFSRLVLSSNTFIDYENATCDFNNPDFIKILEFCNEFPNLGEGDEINWDNATDEELANYSKSMQSAVREDRVLLYDANIASAREYAHIKYGYVGDDITLIGTPTSEGASVRIITSSNYAIMQTSENKDICWEFIKSVLIKEENSLYQGNHFPALKAYFEKTFDDAMSKPYYLDANGEKVEYDDVCYINDTEMKIPPLTQAERDAFYEYVSNAKPDDYYYNNAIYNIITEEADVYFAGDKTAEQTAEIIQNRVSILISEQS